MKHLLLLVLLSLSEQKSANVVNEIEASGIELGKLIYIKCYDKCKIMAAPAAAARITRQPKHLH